MIPTEAVPAADSPVLDNLVRICCGDFPPMSKHHLGSNFHLGCSLIHRLLYRDFHIRFCQVLLPDRSCSLDAIPRTNRRLSGVQIDQVLFYK
ncbi:hypothetical protein D3C81_1876530 [compost metagenome]